MARTELIRVSRKKRLFLKAKADSLGLSMPELLEFAQFPFIPLEDVKKNVKK